MNGDSLMIGLKGFSPRNLLYMKQFAEAYSVSILERFIYVEKELKGMKSISQQAVAKFPEELKSSLPDVSDLENELSKEGIE